MWPVPPIWQSEGSLVFTLFLVDSIWKSRPSVIPLNIPEPVFSPHQLLQGTLLSLGQPSLPLLPLENLPVPGSSFNPKPELRVPVLCSGAGGPCSHLAVLLTPWFSFGVLFLPFDTCPFLFVHDVILFSR